MSFVSLPFFLLQVSREVEADDLYLFTGTLPSLMLFETSPTPSPSSPSSLSSPRLPLLLQPSPLPSPSTVLDSWPSGSSTSCDRSAFERSSSRSREFTTRSRLEERRSLGLRDTRSLNTLVQALVLLLYIERLHPDFLSTFLSRSGSHRRRFPYPPHLPRTSPNPPRICSLQALHRHQPRLPSSSRPSQGRGWSRIRSLHPLREAQGSLRRGRGCQRRR